MKKISIQEAINIQPDFKGKTKEEACYNWVLSFREHLLKNNLAEFGDIIPSKKDISKFLNVSTGVVQNAIRYAEDKGYFASKQCIGTMIANPNITEEFKPVTKKIKAYNELKKYLITNEYKKGEILPSISSLAVYLKFSKNTLRLAVNQFVEEGIFRKETYKNNISLILNSEIKDFEKTNIDFRNKDLPKLLKENIKKFLRVNYKTGEKIPTNAYFAKMYKVSISTINSCMKELNKEKFILSRRGSLGSVLLERSEDEKSRALNKKYNYRYEEVLAEIKNYILKNSEAGDKIPTIQEFANNLNVSTTTVKKAVQNLIKSGILYAQRGKYGGLFVVEMPENEGSYRWLAINSDFLDI